MVRHKKKHKKKSPSLTLLTPEEEAFVTSVLQDFKNSDPTETLARIPDSRHALILAERVALDDESPVPLLVALKDGFEDKRVRRAVKRALFKLKKKGVQVEESYPEKGNMPAVLRPAEKDRPRAYAGPIDMGGFRGVLVTFQRSVKGVDLGLGVVSNEHGIQHFLSGTYSKKRVRELRDHMSEEAGPLVEISLSHAVTILEAAYQRHVELNSDAPAEYLELRPWLLDNASLLERPAIHELIPEVSASEPALTNSQLERLFEHDLMKSWIIEVDRLKPCIEEILEVDESLIVLTETQKLERVSEIKEKSAEELFPASMRALLKHRFEEMAYLFFKLGEEDVSLLSVAAARSMDEEDTVLRKNPVVEFLFERSLNFYANAMKEAGESQDRAEESSSRILLP